MQINAATPEEKDFINEVRLKFGREFNSYYFYGKLYFVYTPLDDKPLLWFTLNSDLKLCLKARNILTENGENLFIYVDLNKKEDVYVFVNKVVALAIKEKEDSAK